MSQPSGPDSSAGTQPVQSTSYGQPAPAQGLSPTVRWLGVVSLFADVSSEMVYPVNPVFITMVLGAPAWVIGVIEGIAESTASLLKLYSGWLSDRFGSRKPFAVIGYGLGAVGKPIIGLANAWPQVLAARFLDRVGKGLRTAPRDALITENCDPSQRGRAFGFHRAMDTTGAVIGPLIGFFWLTRLAHLSRAEHIAGLRTLYFIAFVPGIIGAFVLWAFVREGGRPEQKRRERPALPTWSSLSAEYRWYLLVVGLFSLGNSSDAFLLLRARDMGVPEAHLLLIYALFNVVEASLGYLAGKTSDRVGRKPLIAAGFLIFGLIYLGFGLLNGAIAVWFLFVAYGLYYTLTQGVQRAYAADLSHPDRRATEIGAFHMLVGIAALPASLLAGVLYSDVAHSAPFLVGAFCAFAAVLMLLATRSRSSAAA